MDGGLFDDDDLSSPTSDIDGGSFESEDPTGRAATAPPAEEDSPRDEFGTSGATNRLRRLPKNVIIAAAASLAVIVIAATIFMSVGGGGGGGGGRSKSQFPSGPPSSSSRAAFAKCLEKYGVTLPSGSPGSGPGPGTGGGAPPSNMSSAFQHCASLLPGGGFTGPPGGSFNGGNGASGGGPIAQ